MANVFMLVSHGYSANTESPSSQRDMAEVFSRVPSKNREGDIVFHRFGQDEQALTLWVHETGHSIDSQIGPDKRTWFTKTHAWLTAYNNDSAVSGVYARVNQRENFAQELNIALLDRNLPGGMNSTNQTQWLQVEHQRSQTPPMQGTRPSKSNPDSVPAARFSRSARRSTRTSTRRFTISSASTSSVWSTPPPPPPPPTRRPDYGPGTPTYPNNTSNGGPDPELPDKPSPSPSPSPDGPIREITWQNVPINNSAAAITAENDKVQLRYHNSNRKFSVDSGFEYSGLHGHGLDAGVGCTPA
ncbi:hypothetical protein V8F33_003174 [Rhypophila sp. PSN 637]